MAKIGVNALYLIPGGVGGTEIYLRELLAALARIDTRNEYFVFTNLETGLNLAPRRANVYSKPQAVRAHSRPARILWEQTILPLEATRYSLDVLFNPGFTAPIAARCRLVTVFHDLQHLRHPEHFRWFDLPPWRFFLWAAAHRSSRLIAVSEATRADLMRYYRLAFGRVAVIPHGVDPALFELPRRADGGYVLCVSTLHPHKNLERFVRAYGRKKRDYRLVLAGMRGFHAAALEKLIANLGLKQEIEITGWISRPQLFELYSDALACIQPSTFEGFGMPVLEAMAAGVPLACSRIPPHVEVVSDTAFLFDPMDEDEIEFALERAVADSSLVDRARERARGFTWERTAERTLDVLLAE